MNYTKSEIKFYEKLAEISSIRTDMVKVVSWNFGKILEVSKQHKWLKEFMEKVWELDKIISRAKIPKKFLILNKLEDKK